MAQSGSAAAQEQFTADKHVSLVRGGPFYRAQQAARLVDEDRWNLGRRILFAITIGWLPMVLITLLARPRAVLGLVTDYPVNARLLVGVPVLLVGQIVMENAFRTIVQHIRAVGLLSPAGLQQMDESIVQLLRWRDSMIPEAVIIVAAYARVWQIAGTHMALARPWALADGHLTAAAWYFALVGQLLYQFLLGISLWKWFLWCAFLFRLSRLDLRLQATHPDHHGGLGFLGMSVLAIAPTVFVASAAIGGTWRAEIMRSGMHLMNFKFYGIVLLLVVVVVALGPLVFFVPKLSKLRRRGILEYGILAQIQSADFHSKWVLNRAGREEEFLAAPEISSLTDFSTSYENVEHLKPFPFDQGAFIGLVLACALPMLPVVLAEVPFAELLKGLMSAVR